MAYSLQYNNVIAFFFELHGTTAGKKITFLFCTDYIAGVVGGSVYKATTRQQALCLQVHLPKKQQMSRKLSSVPSTVQSPFEGELPAEIRQLTAMADTVRGHGECRNGNSRSR